MQKVVVVILICIVSCFNLRADTYPEVVFDNSLVKGAYARSLVKYDGESWVENVNKHLLVSDTLFFTPGNSLSLKYLTAQKGKWKVDIRYSRQKINYEFDPENNLIFRILVKSKNTTVKHLPKIAVSVRNTISDTLHLEKYISNLEYGKWIEVQVPCKDFKIKSTKESIAGVTFVQGESSKDTHHVFLDQIEFLPNKYPKVPMLANAVLTEAIAYDKAVHLKWQLPLTPSIRYIKIYRADDNDNYKPIAIKPIQMQSCLDIVSEFNKEYKYKIAWLNYDYQESNFSQIKTVKVEQASDSSILNLIQLAHINYFVENYDINSGMYMPFRSRDKAVVSTKETAAAIYALIVGVERKYVSKQMALQRVSKIAYFLLKAQSRFGIFPSYFDGRKAVPEYRRGAEYYDIEGTASLIEALLVARQYFDGTDELQKDVRNRITALYDQIQWTQLTLNKFPTILKSKVDMMDRAGDPEDLHKESINGAAHANNVYLLAVGANKNALSKKSFYDGVYHKFKKESFLFNPNDSLNVVDSLFQIESLNNQTMNVNPLDSNTVNWKLVGLKDTVFRYGLRLTNGDLDRSLMEIIQPFLVASPAFVSQDSINWEEVLFNYTHFVKRRDNESGVGSSHSDIWGFYRFKDSIADYKINPAIGASSIMVDSKLGESAILALYKQFGSILFTEYGFRSWIDLRHDDVSDEYLAINQSAVILGIENRRTGLIWNLYQKIPEIQRARNLVFDISTSANE